MRVEHLEGWRLDYWTAVADGIKDDPRYGFRYDKRYDECRWYGDAECGDEEYSPSVFWSIAGPIIDINKINLECINHIHWRAYVGEISYTGTSPTMAAMRCFVASKYGETVPDVDFP